MPLPTDTVTHSSYQDRVWCQTRRYIADNHLIDLRGSASGRVDGDGLTVDSDSRADSHAFVSYVKTDSRPITGY